MESEVKIFARLGQFEKNYNVKILLAVESGSRGWGFASEDSDYDVRFVYAHPRERYLHLISPAGASHDWIDGEIDYEGYDIHKFYDLLLKSNMNIIDWLMQDVVYIDKLHDTVSLQKLVAKSFDRRTYCAHNFGLATKNYNKYFNSMAPNEPTIKRYVYCIRALLSAKYCMDHNKLAPLKFDMLLQKTMKDGNLQELRDMVELKKNTKEKERYYNQKWKDFIEINLKQPIGCQNMSIDDFHKYYESLNQHMLRQMEE